jgi:hypothetical protein
MTRKGKRAPIIMEQIPLTAILLELLPTDANDADPALLASIGMEVTTILRDQGETVQPVYSGRRGGELVLQIISAAWDQKEIILSDMSSLITILTPIVLIAQHIKHAYAKHAGQQVAQTYPVTVTLEIKGITLTVEAVTLPKVYPRREAKFIRSYAQKDEVHLAEILGGGSKGGPQVQMGWQSVSAST